MLKSVPPRVYISVVTLLILGWALYLKGDVKAAFKAFGVELSIDAKDRASEQTR